MIMETSNNKIGTLGVNVQLTESSAVYLVLASVTIILVFFLSKKFIR